MLHLIHTIPGDSHWEQFLAVPGEVFAYPAQQIGLKNQINHDFFFKGLLLIQEGKSVGRIAVYLNHSLEVRGMRTGTLGNYEAIDEERVGKQLLKAGIELLEEEGMEYIVGPMNGSSWDQYRFELHHQRQPFFLEPLNPGWYLSHWRAAGFRSLGNYSSGLDERMTVEENDRNRITALPQRGITIRNIDLDQYEAELDLLYPLCLEGFSRNHLYTPISRESFFAKYVPIKSAIDPEWVLIAENEEGDPGGFIFCFPDYWNQTEKLLVVKTIVRHPGREWAGIGNTLSSIIVQKAKAAGFEGIIHAMMYLGGGGKSLSEKYHGETIQEYVLLGRGIGKMANGKDGKTRELI